MKILYMCVSHNKGRFLAKLKLIEPQNNVFL